MKQISLILVCLALLTACNKNQVVPVTVNVISSNVIDTFTLTDNGITYIDTGTSHFGTGAAITISEQAGNDFLNIIAGPNLHFPFEFSIQDIMGPGNGVGLYTLPAADSMNGNSFAEAYSGGEGYTIDSAAVNLTTVSTTLVAGTYELWLSNINGRKTISGTIKCHHPVIE